MIVIGDTCCRYDALTRVLQVSSLRGTCACLSAYVAVLGFDGEEDERYRFQGGYTSGFQYI